jgi:plasmid maintenance system antidote protein VapI
MSNPVPDNVLQTDPFDALFREAEKSDEYWISKAKLRFTEDMLAQMEANAVSKTELAERLGVRPAQITRLCSGLNNFTVETMVRIARALNCELHTHLQAETVTTHWIDVLKEEPARPAWAEPSAIFKAIASQHVEEEAPHVIGTAA